MVGVAVVPRHPLGRGDDVDAGLENALVELQVRPDAMEGQAVRPCGQDGIDGAGGADADRPDAGDFTDIAATFSGE
jgi:hypothetical protein